MRCARVIALLATSAALVGCSSGAADKAGGSKAPILLTVGDSDTSDQPDTAAIEHFAAQVDRLSTGSVHIRIVYGAAGSATPYVEERVIQSVRAGRFDLGWVGARAWDEVGIKAFRALQAPFLITSTRLLDRVATGDVANEMLGSLPSREFIGLALVPDFLRHPIGLTHKLTSPADFAGARIRIQPSRVSAAVMRSLGAIPLEISNQQIGVSIGAKRVDAEELSLMNAVSPSIITGNLTFFPKALTLFANRASFDRLDDHQRSILKAAAAETVRHVVAHYPTDADISTSCLNRRRIVLATEDEQTALLQLTQPVYRMLEAHPQTRRLIAQIRALKRTSPADPPLVLTRRCEHTERAAQAPGVKRPASFLNGTYRWVLTLADARRGGPGKDPDPGTVFPITGTAVLRDGTWEFAGPDHDNGTYSIRGDRLRFVWPSIPSILVFQFKRDEDGTLNLKPVLPMDKGDQFIWAYKPWRRIGPPTKLER